MKLSSKIFIIFLLLIAFPVAALGEISDFDAPVIFQVNAINPQSMQTDFYITTADQPYWILGPQGLNASSNYKYRARIIANSESKRISISGTIDDLVIIDGRTRRLERVGVKASYELNIDGITFANKNFSIGKDPLNNQADLIAIGDLGIVSSGTLNLEHPDPLVFGPTLSVKLNIEAAFTDVASSDPKWGGLASTSQRREFAMFWGPIPGGKNYSYFEDMPELATWFSSAENLNLFGRSFMVKGDGHFGNDVSLVTQETCCNNFNQTGLLTSIDSDSHQFARLIRKSAKLLPRTGPKGASNKKFIAKTSNNTKSEVDDIWASVWVLPTTFLECRVTDPACQCVRSSLSVERNNLQFAYDELVKSKTEVDKKLISSFGGTSQLPKKYQRLNSAMLDLQKNIQSAINQTSQSQDFCS